MEEDEQHAVGCIGGTTCGGGIGAVVRDADELGK
jgi:hypothetical protein